MKKITSKQMSEIEGGTKCIYHYIGHVFFGVLTAGLYYGNEQAISECWNNVHVGG
jgi:hypothetical protein